MLLLSTAPFHSSEPPVHPPFPHRYAADIYDPQNSMLLLVVRHVALCTEVEIPLPLSLLAPMVVSDKALHLEHIETAMGRLGLSTLLGLFGFSETSDSEAVGNGMDYVASAIGEAVAAEPRLPFAIRGRSPSSLAAPSNGW